MCVIRTQTRKPNTEYQIQTHTHTHIPTDNVNAVMMANSKDFVVLDFCHSGSAWAHAKRKACE